MLDRFCITAPFLSRFSLSLFSSKLSFVAFSLGPSITLALAVTVTSFSISLAGFIVLTSLRFYLCVILYSDLA